VDHVIPEVTVDPLVVAIKGSPILTVDFESVSPAFMLPPEVLVFL